MNETDLNDETASLRSRHQGHSLLVRKYKIEERRMNQFVVVIVEGPFHRFLCSIIFTNEREDSRCASDGNAGGIAILDDEQVGHIMVEHVGLAHALFGDDVAGRKETMKRVLKRRLAVVAGIHLPSELVGWNLRT